MAGGAPGEGEARPREDRLGSAAWTSTAETLAKASDARPLNAAFPAFSPRQCRPLPLPSVAPPSPQGTPAGLAPGPCSAGRGRRLRQEPGNRRPPLCHQPPGRGAPRGSRGCRSADRDTRRRPPLRRFPGKNSRGLCLPGNAPGRGRLRWRGKSFASGAASGGDATRW